MNVIATNQRNSYEQAVDSFGDVYSNDNDGQKPHCRTTWLMEYGSLGYASRDGLTRWQVLETLRLEASPQVYVDEQAAEQLMRLVD